MPDHLKATPQGRIDHASRPLLGPDGRAGRVPARYGGGYQGGHLRCSMASIACWKCAKSVNDTDTECKHCGAPIGAAQLAEQDERLSGVTVTTTGNVEGK